jgi:Glycine zipper
MKQRGWNPWKLTAIGMAVVVVTALVTGLVVANWTGGERDRSAADRPASKVAGQSAHPARVSSAVAATPSKNAIEACNRYAANEAGIQRDTKGKTVEVVKDGAIGAAVGAAVGAAGGAIADGGKGAGKGAAIGGLVGAGAGSLYGLNENKQSDERYRAAYSSCMRARGYTS